jgi:biopolymer transport protein TolR
MDVEINLVPFIDLLSCCICFLLISAVWTQVAKIDVKPAPNLPSDSPPPEEKIKLQVDIVGIGYKLSDGAGSSVDLPKTGDGYPHKELNERLKLFHETYPDITAITVRAEDVVEYKELIKVMDLSLQHGLGDIVVAGT